MGAEYSYGGGRLNGSKIRSVDKGYDERWEKGQTSELEGATKWTHHGTLLSEQLLLNVDGPTNSSRHCQRLPRIVCCHVD